MRTLVYQCPSCQQKLAPVGGVQAATQVVRRKCRRCGERWQIVIEPSLRSQIWFDIGTFTFLGRKGCSLSNKFEAPGNTGKTSTT